jgi:hypothetical protein
LEALFQACRTKHSTVPTFKGLPTSNLRIPQKTKQRRKEGQHYGKVVLAIPERGSGRRVGSSTGVNGGRERLIQRPLGQEPGREVGSLTD